MPLVPVLAAMEARGMSFAADASASLKAELVLRLRAIQVALVAVDYMMHIGGIT